MATKQQVAAATEKACLLGHLLWGFGDCAPLIEPKRLDALIKTFDDLAIELEKLLEVPGVQGELSLGNPQPVKVAGWFNDCHAAAVLLAAKALVRKLRMELPMDPHLPMLNTAQAFNRVRVDGDILIQCQKEYERRYREPLPDPGQTSTKKAHIELIEQMFDSGMTNKQVYEQARQWSISEENVRTIKSRLGQKRGEKL